MMAPKLYAYLVVAFVVAAGLAGLYAKGRLDARHAAQLASLQQEVFRLKASAEQERKARVLDTIQAKLDAEDKADLANRITELNTYAESLAGAACLDDTDTERLRTLWR